MTREDASEIVNAYAKLLSSKNLPMGYPMVVVANKIDGEALQVIFHNYFNRRDGQQFTIIPVDLPVTTDHGGTLEDLSTITGSRVVTSQSVKLSASDLYNCAGIASNIRTSKKITYIVAKNDDESISDNISKLIENLKARQEAITTLDGESERANISVRLSKLNGYHATIEVGAPTDIERNERKLKYDDAVLATYAAHREGVVYGAGCTYVEAYSFIKKYVEESEVMSMSHAEKFGFRLVLDNIVKLYSMIPQNSGINVEKEMTELGPIEYSDLVDNLIYIDLDSMKVVKIDKKDCKIFDPYTVSKSVIENAVSAVAMFISTENAVLCELPQQT